MHVNNNRDFQDADYLLKERVSSIKSGIDQIYYGLLSCSDKKEKEESLVKLRGQVDFLQTVLHDGIIQKSDQIKNLDLQLTEVNKELELFKKKLGKKVKKKTKQLKNVEHVTIFALTRLAEYRDRETGEHLNRIRHYSLLIAKELSDHIYKGYITEKYAKNIFHSSPLHDIGKVGVSDRILLKPGSLSAAEFEFVKEHTIIGGKTLEEAEAQLKYKSKSFLSMGKNIAYFHHEKWDGSGYPFGVKKEKIPLSARIVALADVYDAITSKRIYKDQMPHEEARRIIINDKGRHFDPVIVDAFVKLESNFSQISNRKKERMD